MKSFRWVFDGRLAFGLPLLLLAGLGILSYEGTRHYQASIERDAATREVLNVVEELSSTLTGLETSARGFVLTGKRSYLERYSPRSERANTLFSQLVKLDSKLLDSESVQELGALIRSKIEVMDETIAARKNLGLNAALRIIDTDRGFLLMESIRAHVLSMQRQLENELNRNSAESSSLQVRNNILIPLGSVISFLLVLGAAFVVRSSSRRLRIRVREATAQERKTAAEAESKAALLQAVLEQMPAAVIVAEAPSGKLVLSNKQVSEVWRHPMIESDSIQAYGEWKGFHPDGRPYAPTDWPLARTLMTNQTFSNEDTIVERGDGTPGVIRLSSAPLRNSRGETFAAVVICEDVTDRKRMEASERERAEILAREQAAIESSRLKSEFLANMSHEIRTPMNAIIGMAELLNETSLDEEQQKYVQTFKKAGDSLLALINDILDISKIEAGDLVFEEIPFDLAEVVDSVMEMMAPRAHSKGLELATRIHPDVRLGLTGDPNRLRQVLVNLVGNAIKFTSAGEVVLSIERDSTNSSVGALLFSVQDTGMGIPPDKVGSLFQRFSQLDSSTTRRFGGTGLGLNICKQIVELQGGTINVESTVGKGSRFSFRIEFKLQEQEHSLERHYELSLKGVRTLIVDDNATNRLILSETLKSWGAAVTEAQSGEAALKILADPALGADPFGLVLVDGRMPGMSGFEFAEKLKGRTSQSTLMMLLSSDNKGDSIARARSAGINDFLVKPIKRSELWSALTKAMKNQSAMISDSGIHSRKPDAQALKELRILLVDDSEDNRNLIVAYLKRTPYQIETAENGEVAVSKFTAGRFDLVLMDMQMPVLDGYGASRKIREFEAKQGRARTPVVALTAHALKAEAQKSYDSGCDAHITKPIKKAVLFKLIQELADPVRKAA